MKKVIVIIAIGVFLSLTLSSGALCDTGRGQAGEGRFRGDSFHGGQFRGDHFGGHFRGDHFGGHFRGDHFRHFGGPRVFFGGFFGFPYYAYPYRYYPYPYYYPYYYPYRPYPRAYAQPPVYTEPGEDSYWYYCQDPQGYYPYVESCPGGWTRVVPTPPRQ